MSFWSHNVKLMDEIITENLPEPWCTQVMEGEVDLYDVPEKVRDTAFCSGEADFWGYQIDAAKMRKDEERLQEALTKEDDKVTPDDGSF